MTIAFRALVRKDLRLFLADRRAVLMSVVAPIVIASFFGYAMGGAGKQETSKISVLVIDQDASAISREIVARLAADKSLEVASSTLAAAREAVRKGKSAIAVVIPKDFGAAAGRAFFGPSAKPELRILYDPSHSVEFNMVQGILTGQIMQVVSKEVFTGQSGRDLLKDSIAEIDRSQGMPTEQRKTLRDLLGSVQKWNALADTRGQSGQPGLSGGLSIPYVVRQEAVTARQGIRYNAYAHAFTGMGVQFILFFGIDVGINLLLQRQRGLWKRLRAAPVSRSMLLGSRAVSAALISMFILLLLFAFARVVFGVRIEGSQAGFYCVCAAFSLMTAAFGLLIAALGKTPEATRGLSAFATLVMVMLGGAWVPTFIFPPWLQQATLFIPTRWAVDGLDGMTWRGLGFMSAVGPIAVLLFCTLLFGTLAVTRFRWEADS